jgi:hypothetical protein
VQHLLSDEPQLSQCSKCAKYIFVCQIDGLESAVDLTPLSLDAYRQALITGRPTFDLAQDSAGRPLRLLRRHAASQWGARQVLASHPCSGAYVNASRVEISANPPQPPASFINAPTAVAPKYSQELKDRAARNVTPARSEKPFVFKPKLCLVCRTFFTDKEIEEGTIYAFYIDYFNWYSRHDFACSPDEQLDVSLRVSAKKLKYPRINKLTGEYLESKKGEVGYEP